VDLSEMLDRTTMNSLAGELPGPLSTEQIYVLEAKSAMMPPTAADLPNMPAPDAAAQTALLNKAFDYASKTYASLPSLGATKTTLRFQDNISAIASASGMSGGAQDSSVATGSGSLNSYVRYINSIETPVAMQGGAEKMPATKDKTPWGRNGQITLQSPDLSLSKVMSEAQASGHFSFVRWENVLGKPAAVFAFTVDKKKGHDDVNICCFPKVDQAGSAHFSSASTGSMNGGGGGGASGNFQTATEWNEFKTSAPYHGEIFVNADTGIVVRMITMVDFKKSDYVRQQDERVDYTPVTVGSQTLILPGRTVIQSEVIPQGDSGVGGNSTRHTYLVSEYKNYAVQ